MKSWTSTNFPSTEIGTSKALKYGEKLWGWYSGYPEVSSKMFIAQIVHQENYNSWPSYYMALVYYI